MKESYPVQVVEYAYHSKVFNVPSFPWWVPHVLKKWESIIAKVKSKYWLITHKFGIIVHKTVEEANCLDQQNGNHLWWGVICKEMKDVSISFDIFDAEVNDLKGY